MTAVRTVETPSVTNTDIGQRALRQRQTVSATVNGGVPSPSLFQTADGRIFALSNGRNAHQFAPGQIFIPTCPNFVLTNSNKK